MVKTLGWQRCSSTLSLCNALVKISILLHKMAKECKVLHLIVHMYIIIRSLKLAFHKYYFVNLFLVNQRRPAFNNRQRRPQQNNRRIGLFDGPPLHKQPGPPYPGPNPRAPNKPLDPTIIHPSNQHPIYRRPGKFFN